MGVRGSFGEQQGGYLACVRKVVACERREVIDVRAYARRLSSLLRGGRGDTEKDTESLSNHRQTFGGNCSSGLDSDEVRSTGERAPR